MGAAIEIEMALDQAVQFEKQLQLLFMQAGKIDVWNKIKARSQAMDIEAAHQARRDKESAAKRRRKIQEMLEIGVGVTIIVIFLIGGGVVLSELVSYCKINGCG
jgi:hypothetical protein